MKSQASEDYLKAIYQLQSEQEPEPVNTSDLASRLGVSSASATGMLKKLSAASPALVDYEPYAGARLTAEGTRQALEIIRHHRLLESYLTQALGFAWDEVHDEAERLEHVISENMEDRMARALGNPSFDPHGEPIPDRDGRLPAQAGARLTGLLPGQSGRLLRVQDASPALLRYLQSLGMVLNARLEVTGRSPFKGPLEVRVVGQDEAVHFLNPEVTDHVYVLLDEQAAPERV